MSSRSITTAAILCLLVIFSTAGLALAADTAQVGIANQYGYADSSAQVVGLGDCAGFDHMELHYAASGSAVWTQLGANITSSVTTASNLYTWNTNAVPTGSYQLRLSVFGAGPSLVTTAYSVLNVNHAAPRVRLTSPANNSTNFNPAGYIKVYFNEGMDPASLTAASVYLMQGTVKVKATLTWNATAKSLTVKPLSRLQDYRWYNLYILKDCSDLAGREMRLGRKIYFRTKDVTAPLITLFGPRHYGRYTSTTAIIASITDNIKVKGAEYYIDGRRAGGLRLSGGKYRNVLNVFGRKGGKHKLTILAVDTFGNRKTLNRYVIFAPKLTTPTVSPSRFSPDGNKVNDYARISVSLNTPSYLTVYVKQAGKIVRIIKKNVAYPAGRRTITWNGKDAAGKRCHNGDYVIYVHASNDGGTSVISAPVEIKVGLKLEIDGPVSIRIDLSERRLYLMSGDRVVAKYGVAIGMGGRFATPLGTRRVIKKEVYPTWYPPSWSSVKHPIPGGPNSPLGPRRLNLGDGYGIHGTNVPSSIGHAVSHGCIRMYSWAILEIYPVVPLGSPVYIVR